MRLLAIVVNWHGMVWYLPRWWFWCCGQWRKASHWVRAGLPNLWEGILALLLLAGPPAALGHWGTPAAEGLQERSGSRAAGWFPPWPSTFRTPHCSILHKTHAWPWLKRSLSLNTTCIYIWHLNPGGLLTNTVNFSAKVLKLLYQNFY